MENKKTERLHLRVSPELKAKIEKAAAADNRSVTNWIECAIINALTKGEKK